MTPYDEQQVYEFLKTEKDAYQEARHPLDDAYPIWVARMQFDAVSQGYTQSRFKHLNECRVALGLQSLPEPEPPSPDQWPPAPGTHPPPPANIATTDVDDVRERVQYWLWASDSNDDESYWMDAIVLDPEPGHTPGWTADSYWTDKIKAGDGVGKGYVWPSQ
jgi:hypothetical protein